jgi:hypothetical protein
VFVGLRIKAQIRLAQPGQHVPIGSEINLILALRILSLGQAKAVQETRGDPMPFASRIVRPDRDDAINKKRWNESHAYFTIQSTCG